MIQLLILIKHFFKLINTYVLRQKKYVKKYLNVQTKIN